uniref:Uncharacterized protein n=1 Tax=Anopheles aquasalis TaxID=42839 RepID=T1DN48_ANOAQ
MNSSGYVIPVTSAPQQRQQSYPLNMISAQGRDMAGNGPRKPTVLTPALPMQTHAVPMAIQNRVQIQYAQPAQAVRSQPYRFDGRRNRTSQQVLRDSEIVKINENGMCKIDMTRLIYRKLQRQGSAGPQPVPPPPMVKLRPAASLRPWRTVPNHGDQQLLATAGISDPALQKVFVDLFAAAAAATHHHGHEQRTTVKFSIFRSVELMAQSSCRRNE